MTILVVRPAKILSLSSIRSFVPEWLVTKFGSTSMLLKSSGVGGGEGGARAVIVSVSETFWSSMSVSVVTVTNNLSFFLLADWLVVLKIMKNETFFFTFLMITGRTILVMTNLGCLIWFYLFSSKILPFYFESR